MNWLTKISRTEEFRRRNRRSVDIKCKLLFFLLMGSEVAISNELQSIKTALNSYSFQSSGIGLPGAAPESENHIKVVSNSTGKNILSVFTQLRPGCMEVNEPMVVSLPAMPLKNVILFCGSTGPGQHETLIAVTDGAEPQIAFVDALESRISLKQLASSEVPFIYSVERLPELADYGVIRMPARYELNWNRSVFSFVPTKLNGGAGVLASEQPDLRLFESPPDRKASIELFLSTNSLLHHDEVCHVYLSKTERSKRLSALEQQRIKLLLKNVINITTCLK